MLDKEAGSDVAGASTLTADDLDCLRGVAGAATVELPEEESEAAAPAAQDVADATCSGDRTETDDVPPAAPAPQRPDRRVRRAAPTSAGVPAGEYERQRTRESKVATACLGKQREGHDWWPVGTELVGRSELRSSPRPWWRTRRSRVVAASESRQARLRAGSASRLRARPSRLRKTIAKPTKWVEAVESPMDGSSGRRRRECPSLPLFFARLSRAHLLTR